MTKKLDQPIFLKKDNKAEEILEVLELHAEKNELCTEGINILKHDIHRIEYGIAGEENIKF